MRAATPKSHPSPPPQNVRGLLTSLKFLVTKTITRPPGNGLASVLYKIIPHPSVSRPINGDIFTEATIEKKDTFLSIFGRMLEGMLFLSLTFLLPNVGLTFLLAPVMPGLFIGLAIGYNLSLICLGFLNMAQKPFSSTALQRRIETMEKLKAFYSVFSTGYRFNFKQQVLFDSVRFAATLTVSVLLNTVINFTYLGIGAGATALSMASIFVPALSVYFAAKLLVLFLRGDDLQHLDAKDGLNTIVTLKEHGIPKDVVEKYTKMAEKNCKAWQQSKHQQAKEPEQKREPTALLARQ